VVCFDSEVYTINIWSDTPFPVANKNTSKNCESGFSQTKIKHLPTILDVLQQKNRKLNLKVQYYKVQYV